MSAIAFGTDGWRAVMAEDFTFANVRRLTEAFCRHLQTAYRPKQGSPPRLVVGYDTRFQSERFARAAAEVISLHGIDAFLTVAPTPTPVVSWSVKHLQTAGAIVITASHNPPIYNGFKIKADYAGSADPSLTRSVERYLEEADREGPVGPHPVRPGEILNYDPRPSYFEQLGRLVDTERIRRSEVHIYCDPLYGAAQGYLPALFGLESDRLTELHAHRDPYFGGLHPEPIPPHVGELCRMVAAGSPPHRLGLAFDGDADRLGVVDEQGCFLESQKVLALLIDFLAAGKGWSGEVVRTFSVGRQVDRVAGELGLTLHETPIGFKYICELMRSRDILIGGEESGGIGIKGHIPERDGILAGLLVLELVARAGKPLGQVVADFERRYGRFVFQRADVEVPHSRSLVESLSRQVPRDLDGRRIVEVSTKDGLKLFFDDGGWLLLRGSGTEPLLRLYAESERQEKVMDLLQAGRQWIEQGILRTTNTRFSNEVTP